MNARLCANCGHPNVPDAHFCSYCGTQMTGDEPLSQQLTVEPTEAPPAGRVPWRALEGLGIWLIATVGAIVVGVPLRLVLSGDAWEVSLILANEALLAVAVVVWIRVRHKVGLQALVRGGRSSDLGVGVALGMAGYFVATIVGGILARVIETVTNRPVEAPEQISVDQPSAILLVMIGISVIVLAPIAEELLFRGVIFRGLRNWAKPGVAIVVSAVFFGIAHLIPLVIPPIFVLGLLLAWIVETRGSLVPSIAAHVTFNVIGFTFLLFEKT